MLLENIKVILLTPIVFDRHNNELVEEVILKLDSDVELKIFSENEWVSLDSEDGYLKNIDGEIDIINALSTERNLNPKIYKEFVKPIRINEEAYILNIDAQLIVNEKHNFLLLFEFTFTNLNVSTSSEFIKNIMDNRNLFVTTNTEKFYETVMDKSLTVINKSLQIILNTETTIINKKNFTIDSSYPLIYVNGFQDDEDLSLLFVNEENLEQRQTASLISNEFHNSFVHIGWNYGVIKNASKNVGQKYLCIMIFLQLNYYLLRFYKNYFQKKIHKLSNKNNFKEHDIKRFDKLKILYHKEFLGYKTYKSGLYPKYYEEFSAIERLWHMEEDISYIEKTFEVQNDYMNKHFQLETEKTNQHLNYGIAVIGLLQIFTIYGVFNDYVSLKTEKDHPEYLNYATDLIIVILVAIFIFLSILYVKSKPFYKE